MNIIYVDDELPARENFRLTVAGIPEIRQLQLFQDGESALEYLRNNSADAAFLDMEMPGLHGLALARCIKAEHPDLPIIFVTAYSQYALDAWGVDATGYVMKPYTVSEIQKELAKCVRRNLSRRSVVIQTIPALSITVNGQSLSLPGAKPRELLALLTDRGTHGLTTGEGIACLWPDRPSDSSTQSLFRMTYKRLASALEEAGAGHILVTKDNRRYLQTDQVECDLYQILAGDVQAARKYDGQYLREYDWAEDRNGQLHRMLLHKI